MRIDARATPPIMTRIGNYSFVEGNLGGLAIAREGGHHILAGTLILEDERRTTMIWGFQGAARLLSVTEPFRILSAEAKGICVVQQS